MPVDYTNADYDFEGDSIGFGEHLRQQFQLQQDNLVILDGEMAEGIEALHGPGKEPGGCSLSTGSGLSCVVAGGYYWVGGRRYLGAEQIVALPALSTRHLYMDAEGSVTLYSSQQSPRPDGTWYVGSATTDGTDCTAVDDSEADVVASPANTETRLAALEAEDIALAGEIESLDGRVTDLESAGGGGSGPAYWGALQKSSGVATTIDQEIDAKIATHLTEAAHGGGGDGGTVVSTEGVWDVDAENQALALLARLKNSPVEEALAEFASQENSIIVVWGVCGEGSNGTDDYVDREHSTWLPA